MNRGHAMRTIFACAKAAGIDKDGINDLAERETGTRSLKALSDPHLQLVVNKIKAQAPASKAAWRPKETRGDLRLIWKLWGLLADAGVVKPGKAALTAFIRNEKFHKKWGEQPTDVSFLTAARAKDVNEALKNIGKRNNVTTIR